MLTLSACIATFAFRQATLGPLEAQAQLQIDVQGLQSSRIIGKYEETSMVVWKEELTAISFDKQVLFHGIHHGRKLVCDGCHALGYCPKDCTPYSCLHDHYCGHRQSKPDGLKLLKRRGTLLACIRCKERKTELLESLRRRGSRECKLLKVEM